MKFHENLKRICTERGTTPTALLKRMGVVTSKVTIWNNGGLPKEDMLLRLAEELGCSVMDFFADDESLKADVVTDDDEREVLRIFRTLGRRERHEFMGIAYEYEKHMAVQGDKSTVNKNA